MASLPLLVLSAGLRAAALPGWFWGPLVVLAVATRIAWWERGGRARGDYAGGVLYWALAFSFLVHTNPDSWFGVAASLGAALILGCVWILEGFLYRRLRGRLPAAVAGVLALVATEWLRSVWTPLGVGGVPWASLGLTLADTPLLPLASLAGEHGLTFVAAAAGAWLHAAGSGARGVRLAGGALLLGGLGVTALLLPTPLEEGTVRTLALQPVVRLEDKHGRWTAPELYEDQVRLTLEALDAGAAPELVVWAETMWPFAAVEETDYTADDILRRPWPDKPAEERSMRRLLIEQQAAVRALLAAAKTRPYFLTGAHFYQPVADPGDPAAMSLRTTDFLLFASSGRLLGHFPKQELVPFGEQLPYRGRFPGAAALTDWTWREYGLRPDFAHSPGGGPLDAQPGLPALGGAVCWENVFSAPFRHQAVAGARAFLILANEDWFGSGGAEMAQMVSATRLRSVETARAALRVTNTGETVLVRADGSVHREGEHGTAPPPSQRGWWECDLPLAPAEATTPYLRGGWLFAPLLAALAGLAAMLPPWRRRLDPPAGGG